MTTTMEWSTTLRLLSPCTLEARSVGGNGDLIVSEHDLDHLLGNHSGHFSTQGKNFSASARNVEIIGPSLSAELREQYNRGWRKASIQVAARRIDAPSGLTHRLVLGDPTGGEIDTDISNDASSATSSTWMRDLLPKGVARFGSKPVKSLQQLLPAGKGPTEDAIRHVQLKESSKVLFECPSSSAGSKKSLNAYSSSCLDLNIQLGNSDGHFSIYGQNFSGSARNVYLHGTKLLADLRTVSGDWRTDEIYLGWLNDGWRLNIAQQRIPVPAALPSSSPYEPLSAHETQIRLCYIQPGAWDEPIVCTMDTRSIGAEDYVCLSYVWGSAQKESKVVLNSQEMAVTNNLAAAVKRLRWHRMAAPIWIDALCINQQDDEERGAQVALMPQIYSKASLVVILLNVDLSDSEILAQSRLDHQWLWPMLATFLRCAAKNVHLHVAIRKAFDMITSGVGWHGNCGVLLPLLTEALHRFASATWQ